MLDDLFSVMSGSYAALKSVAIKVSIPTADDSSPRKFAVLGYGTGFQIADFVYWHDVIAKATIEVDWASLVETFQSVWKESKIPFKWFRSSQVNKRYIEEKFAYVIRISELYFKPENVVDSEGEIVLAKITAALEGDRDTLAAVAKRIAPILRGSPSLVATLRAIAAKYPELAIWADYNPKDIARLRGKEMHGSDAHYSGDEYRCMYDASLGLLLAFRLDVLSKCGFDRAQLIESSPKSQHVRRLIKRQVNTPDQPT